jgi:hypothetical protein
MARGWESKSVEQQQEAAAGSHPAGPRLTADQIDKQRQRNDLLLSRKHVLQQLQAAQSPRHREMLESALAELDSRLARLG